MRQRDDVPFVTVLNNMAIEAMTESDIEIFQSQVVQISPESAADINNEKITVSLNIISQESTSSTGTSSKLIFLFSRNSFVQQTNQNILMSLNTEGAISKAFDQIIGQCRDGSYIQRLLFSADNHAKQFDIQGLIKTLLLKISEKYMMTVNIDTTDGLVNETKGILETFVNSDL